MILYIWMMIQVVCESLPISSSGHVLLFLQNAQKYMPWYIVNIEQLQAFDYAVQSINAIVIFFYFFTAWWHLIIKGPLQLSSLCSWDVWKKNIAHVALFGCIADGITCLFWMFDITNILPIPLALGFAITGCVLWVSQLSRERNDIYIWDPRFAFLIGCVQGIALLPGISRFAITVTTLQWLGYKKPQAFAVSFLLQWPLLVVGSLQGFLHIHDQYIVKTMMNMSFMVCAIVAAIISYALLMYMARLFDENKIWKFSYYMIIPTMIALLV